MFKRLEIKKIFAFLLVACMLAGGIAMLPATAYAEPTEEPAVTEEVAQEPTTEEGAAEEPAQQPAPTQSQQASGIVVDAAEEEEEEANPMDTILGFDTVIKEIWSKWCSRLLIILGILVAVVIGLVIYIMVTQTTKLSKQNKEMSRRPDRQLASNQPAPGEAESVRQVKQFGDTLRIRRTVSQQGNAPAQQANMQRPMAPQRPSRPAQQGTAQPGVRRPVQGQPVRRPVPGQQPQRPNGAGIHQPQRPAQTGARPVQRSAQPGARPVQRPAQPGARPVQRPAQPAAPTQTNDQNK